MHNSLQKWTAAFLFFCFVHLLCGAADKNTAPQPEEKKEGQPVSITKLIPGLYQLKSKKTIKGTLLFCAFTAAVLSALAANKKGNDLYEQYLNSTDKAEVIALRKETEKKFKKRNLYIAGALGTWLIHLLDLKLFKNKKGGIKGEIANQQINIGVYYSF
ncbi:MAG: hypothetical protein KAW12_02480 [Candidatus Aminicenantes bacterium]|nr:hypothetical protein [Candidatus Aminicenantes bacterium]